MPIDAMTDTRPVVLVVVRRPPLAPEALAVADALHGEGRYRPVVATEREGFGFMSPADLGRFSFVDSDGRPLAAAPQAVGGSTSRTVSERVRSLLSRASRRLPPLALALSVQSLRKAKAQVVGLLDRTRPVAIIVFDDRAPGHPMLLVHEARRRGIPSILLPFAASSVESVHLIRAGKRQYQVDAGLDRWIKRYFAASSPAHVHAVADERYLFFPWPTMAALRLFDLHGTKPWVMGGGETSIVGLFNADEAQELVAHGVDRARLRLIGQPATDALFRSDRKRLQAELRKTVIVRYSYVPCHRPASTEWRHGTTTCAIPRRCSKQ